MVYLFEGRLVRVRVRVVIIEQTEQSTDLIYNINNTYDCK